MKILVLSRYSTLGASSRLRFFQYLPHIEKNGWHVTKSPLFTDEYLKALYQNHSLIKPVLKAYWRRFRTLMVSKRYDLIWVEKELLPYLPEPIEHLLLCSDKPCIVDYDDAWFHRYDKHGSRLIRWVLGNKIDRVMKNASLVVAGNDYLADRARGADAKWIETIPTVVDVSRYRISPASTNRSAIIGWIGSPATSFYLTSISSAIQFLAKEHSVKFVALGADSRTLAGLPIEIWPWSEQTEVRCLQSFDIGIMPLIDSPWERGKCGYKLIQYMACGKPVIATPVGVNKDIVEHGKNGFLATTIGDWVEAIRTLAENADLRNEMGMAGRVKVIKKYSLQTAVPKMISVFQKALERA